MTDADTPTRPAPKKNIFAQLELDTRLLGMIGAFVILCLGFHLITDGRFLTSRNIFNLTIQTLITPEVFGLGLNHPATAPIAIAVGILTGVAVGAFQGYIIGYLGVPAFIVTLGGLLIWRNVAWYLTNGQTIGPLDRNFMEFGGINGTLGETWSWVFGIAAVLFAFYSLWRNRRNKIAHEFPVKPVWAEFVLGGISAVAILGFVAILNNYAIPSRRLERMFEARGEVMPEGFTQGYGLPISVLLLIAVAVVMTIVARRTRLGRSIFATGGNPDAAELSGINTRLLTVKVFAIMGGLCGLAALVASARLSFHSNDIGTLDELRVIAAAVIGGTALAGGMGTIYGAILGALIMQSLQSGMAMVGVDAPFQNIVVGAVLVLAVLVDTIYRMRTGAK